MNRKESPSPFLLTPERPRNTKQHSNLKSLLNASSPPMMEPPSSSLYYSARDVMRSDDSDLLNREKPQSISNGTSTSTSTSSNDAFLSSRVLQDRFQQERDRVKSKRDRLRSNRTLDAEKSSNESESLPLNSNGNGNNSNNLTQTYPTTTTTMDDSMAFMSTTSGSHLVENDDGWIDATGLTTLSSNADSPGSPSPKHQKVIPFTTRNRHKKDSVDGSCWNRYKLLLLSLALLCLAGGITATAVLSRNANGDANSNSNNNNNNAGITNPSCESATNILSACKCRDELPDALSPEVTYNRNLILHFLTINAALPANYSDTTSSISCQADNQALVWISNLNNHLVLPPSNLQLLQRYALALLYQTLHGNMWTTTTTTPTASTTTTDMNSSPWLDPSTSECDWNGVICSDVSQRIIELRLSNHHLQGVLPTSALALLESLRELHLDDNPKLSGRLDSDLTALPLLQTLQLSHTSIGSSSSSSSSSDSGGSLPTEWGTRLSELLLSDMQLDGTVPTELGLLGRLRTLDLSMNALTGTIPMELSTDLPELQELDMSSNQLRGALPLTWNSPVLETLYLHDNINLSGIFPEPYDPLLSFIHFGGTALEGTVPSAYCSLIYLDSLVVDCSNDNVDTESCSCCQCTDDDSE